MRAARTGRRSVEPGLVGHPGVDGGPVEHRLAVAEGLGGERRRVDGIGVACDPRPSPRIGHPEDPRGHGGVLPDVQASRRIGSVGPAVVENLDLRSPPYLVGLSPGLPGDVLGHLPVDRAVCASDPCADEQTRRRGIADDRGELDVHCHRRADGHRLGELPPLIGHDEPRNGDGNGRIGEQVDRRFEAQRMQKGGRRAVTRSVSQERGESGRPAGRRSRPLRTLRQRRVGWSGSGAESPLRRHGKDSGKLRQAHGVPPIHYEAPGYRAHSPMKGRQACAPLERRRGTASPPTEPTVEGGAPTERGDEGACEAVARRRGRIGGTLKEQAKGKAPEARVLPREDLRSVGDESGFVGFHEPTGNAHVAALNADGLKLGELCLPLGTARARIAAGHLPFGYCHCYRSSRYWAAMATQWTSRGRSPTHREKDYPTEATAVIPEAVRTPGSPGGLSHTREFAVIGHLAQTHAR